MKLYLVGFGAGSYDGMTIEAKKAIEDCDIIVGYTVYVELLKKYFDDKTFFIFSLQLLLSDELIIIGFTITIL